MKISVVILTRNEEENIEKCLKSLGFVDEIVVVDDFSTDKTLEKIQKIEVKSQNLKSKVKIFQRKLQGDFSEQRNFGMSKTSNEWVLFVDADEEVTKNLEFRIKNLEFDKGAYYIKRRDFFWSKELKFGEIRKVRFMGLIRLIRKGSGEWFGKVHEEFRIKNLELGVSKLDNYINHYPHQSLKEFIHDVNNYSSLRAKELYSLGKRTNLLEIILWPFGKFVYNYLFNLGFLDGVQGFTYAFLMSFHSFLVRAKLWQYYSI